MHSPMLFVNNKDKRGRIEGVGSGIYIEHEGLKYIVTTGHIFLKYSCNDVKIQGIDFSLSNDTQGIIFLPEKEEVDKECDFSETDYGIFKVLDDSIRKIERLYRPFPLSSIVKSQEFTSLWCHVFGYPSSQNVQQSTRKSFIATHVNMRLPRVLNELNEVKGNGFCQDVNMALRFTIDNTIRTHALESRSFGRAPKPNGLSGCGIWAVPHYPFAAETYCLQGMLTHYNRTKAMLVGFKVQDMVEMMEATNENCKIIAKTAITHQ
uniref:Trypsin-like serine protease with C-terminal PDZ domain n=1 Tax=Desulfovibrio sp. U5L TaxID=596152 RepID=I2Q4F9_9BACT